MNTKLFLTMAAALLTLTATATDAEAASTGRVYLMLKNSGVGDFSSTRQVNVYAKQTDSFGGSRTAYAPRYGTARPGSVFLAEFTYGLTRFDGFRGTYRFEVSFEDSDGNREYIFAPGTRLTGSDSYYISRCGVSTRRPSDSCAFDIANEAPPVATRLHCYPDPNGPATGMYVHWSATPRPSDYRNVELQRLDPGSSFWRVVRDTYTWGSQLHIDGGVKSDTSYRYRVVTYDRYGASANSVELSCRTESGDRDGDGFLAPADCDDTDASIHPDAFDIPGDGIDQDCDGADAEGLDRDGDGVEDALDNCVDTPNPLQSDLDEDGLGDACDSDIDDDGVSNESDNCPRVVNATQDDLDRDGLGDACDRDIDDDGVENPSDNCERTANPFQFDLDRDGLGDACDSDDDGDGVEDQDDNCPNTANTTQDDLDRDELGDACDEDDDDDSVDDVFDVCPRDFDPEQYDLDGDGLGDVCDSDDDGDEVEDGIDNCLGLFNPEQTDVDRDNIGDDCDPLIDSDGDGVEDATDNCPLIPNAEQDDLDGDSIGDACDEDLDDDGVENEEDLCPIDDAGPADYNQDGCADTACDLVEVIESFSPEDLDPRLVNSLRAKARNACNSTQSGRTQATEGQLTGLRNEVRAQTGRKISQNAAEVLTLIIDTLLEQNR